MMGLKFYASYVGEAGRIFYHGLKNRVRFKKYEGNAEQICKQVVKDCWNGRFFQTATDNFPQFWARDFGWCTQSLMKLGYKEEVHHTLRYALNRFKQYNRVTTTITPAGRPFNYPVPAVDSLPWLIHSIRISKFSYHSFKPFLNKEIRKFFDYFIDANTGLVKADLHVSSMKDFSVRNSSCYDNAMVALLAKDLKYMKLDNLFINYDYTELLTRHLWNGEYFYDDLNKHAYVAGDANLFPFILGIIKDESMMKSAIKAMRNAGLDDPFPLKYTNTRRGVKFIAEEKMFMKDYESTAIWMHMGPLYVKWLQHINPVRAKELQDVYTGLIEKHGNFMEVYTKDGRLYKNPFYHSAPGMLWAANYLTL